jgi:site-specific recombinase XerD
VVNRAIQWQRGRGLVVTEPKTRRSRRSVPLPHGTVAVLRSHRAEQLEEQVRRANVWEKRDLVFCGHTGRPLHATSLNVALSRALDRAGLQHIRVHDLRHTAATHLLHRGIHPKVVQELLGHSTISLTLDTYSHVTISLTAKAADEMEDLFTPSARAV